MNKNIDYGDLPAKTLVNLGKEVVKRQANSNDAYYGSLPSKTLPELGKEELQKILNNDQ